MKILVFNLRYGANLGDRLISACLHAGLEQCDPSLTVVSEDLGGRDAPPQDRGGWRVAALTLLQALPGPWRKALTRRMLERLVQRRLLPRWRAIASDADAIVVGGGGIFADSDLNFPMKIAAALHVAAERNLPVVVHAVGAAPRWSPEGRRILGQALQASRLRGFSLRDEEAITMLREELRDYTLPPLTLAPDPALTLAQHVDLPPRRLSSAKTSADGTTPLVIGLCLTSPAALRYHGVPGAAARRMVTWYLELTGELTRRNHRVLGFTTGATEDRRFAEKLSPSFLDHACGKGQMLPTARDPQDFVRMIGGMDALIAHRLHAVLTGHALGIPALALRWERKMEGQMAMLGLTDRLLDAGQLDITAAADLIEHYAVQGVDLAHLDRLASSSAQAIHQLVLTLRRATQDGPPRASGLPVPPTAAMPEGILSQAG